MYEPIIQILPPEPLNSFHKDSTYQEKLCALLKKEYLFNEAKKLQSCLRIFGSYSCSCGKKHIAVYHRCMLKICPSCNALRAKIIEERYTPHIEKSKNLKFLTLTIVNTNELTKEILQNIKKQFKRLRLELFKEYNYKGGLYRTEITYNKEKKTWHPHIHALIDMDYIPQKILSEYWASLMCDNSFIVGIRNAKDDDINYTLKYTLKQQDILPLFDYLFATKGLRSVQPFGSWMQKEDIKSERDYELNEEIILSEIDPPETSYKVATHWTKENNKSFLNIKHEVDCTCGQKMKLDINNHFGLSVFHQWINYN